MHSYVAPVETNIAPPAPTHVPLVEKIEPVIVERAYATQVPLYENLEQTALSRKQQPSQSTITRPPADLATMKEDIDYLDVPAFLRRQEED